MPRAKPDNHAAGVPSLERPSGSAAVAGDCRGSNFYEGDASLRSLLRLYMNEPLRRHLEPHLHRLGELAGGRLDELAQVADRNEPVLHARDRFGRDEDWIEYHPAYREMERIAFEEFGLHAMSHRGGVLGWPEPMPPIAKYAMQYLFVQAEFGLMCPVSVSDTSAHLLLAYGGDELRRLFVEGMLSQDATAMLKGTQFMTEKTGGSDVGAAEATARREGDRWRLHGEKWFCSHADADVALILARPEGAPSGTKGLGLFAMPRRLEDGSRNHYRIVRLKRKLGTRSMASGEIRLEGAVAYQVGALDRGIKQMLEQVNLSRLSHGVRAAAMMRRCWNESLVVARTRVAFGSRLIDLPLLRRQLMKILVPAEQALSLFAFTAAVMEAANAGDPGARDALRTLTPVFKFRSCRDNIRVATGAMEVRGGNGYIEDWVNARLVRDAHVGVLWEGTSNIVALDVVTRAVARGAHTALRALLRRRLSEARAVPESWRDRVGADLERAFAFAEEVASTPRHEKRARSVSSALYHATSAALMTWEAARLAAEDGDARRLLLARLVLEHRLSPQAPMTMADDAWEERATELLLDAAPVPLDVAAALVTR